MQTRLPTGFASLDRPDSWPPPRGRARPERLLAGVETLPGVGPALKRKLAALGLRTVGDVLLHRPRRYEPAAPEVAISDVFGEDEVAIAGEVVSASVRRLRGRLTAVDARIKDASGTIGARWFNQPWLADKLTPGTHVRLRGHLTRYGFQVKSYDLGEAHAGSAQSRRTSRPSTRRARTSR